MNGTMIFLTPLLALLIIGVVFRFTGCGKYLPPPEEPVEPPPRKVEEPPPVVTPPPPPPPAATYGDVVSATPGFAALWPLNETAGNVATVVGPLNPAANGTYTTIGSAPPGSGYKLGDPGVLSHKDATDFAPTFNSAAAYAEIPFNGPLNPPKVAGFTVELWVKPNPPTVVGDTQVLVSSHRLNTATNQQGYEIALVKVAGQANQQVRARVFNNTAAPGQSMLVPLQGDADEWRHIVMVYKVDPMIGGTISLHVRLAKSAGGFKDGPHGGNYEPVLSSTGSTLRFGAGHGNGQAPANFLSGRIDNVAFYNAVLDQNEIDKHFNMF